MDFVNAIAKVRFSSVKPQRILLHKGKVVQVEMICMEGGQEISIGSGEWSHYVITGQAVITAAGRSSELATGHFAASVGQEPHTIANVGEQRLVCLTISAVQ